MKTPREDVLKFARLVDEIRCPDDADLSTFGGKIEAYEGILRDGQVAAVFQSRRRAVTSRPWQVEAGGDSDLDERAAESLRAQMKKIEFDRVTDEMLFAVFYGFLVAEIMWGHGDGETVIEKIKVRDPKRFGFGKKQELRLRVEGRMDQSIEMPDKKFWVLKSGGARPDDPYGRGLGLNLYLPVFLKRKTMLFWAQALEKFGTPTVLGRFPSSTEEEDKEKLLEAVHAVSSSRAIIAPDTMTVDLLEAQRRAGGDHSIFIRYLDAEISKVISSQTMTTDDGSSLSQSETHADVKQEVVQADSKLICESFSSGPARWLTDWNFPGAATPQVTRVFEDEEDLSKAAERDERLHKMGYIRNIESVNEQYGNHYSLSPEATGVKAPVSESAVPANEAKAEPRDAAKPGTDFAAGGAARDSAQSRSHGWRFEIAGSHGWHFEIAGSHGWRFEIAGSQGWLFRVIDKTLKYLHWRTWRGIEVR